MVLRFPAPDAPGGAGTGAGRAPVPRKRSERFSFGLALLCLVVSLALQVGVNFANDYSDGVRGTDAVRVGPTRLTASGGGAHGRSNTPPSPSSLSPGWPVSSSPC